MSKTVGESDVQLVAGITGDLSPNHANEEVMRRSRCGRRITHGALLVGFMSAASSLMIGACRGSARGEMPVSLGYDRIRFVAPVFIGDTLAVTYRIAASDVERRRSRSGITLTSQHGETVAVSQHILKWMPNAAGADQP